VFLSFAVDGFGSGATQSDSRWGFDTHGPDLSWALATSYAFCAVMSCTRAVARLVSAWARAISAACPRPRNPGLP